MPDYEAMPLSSRTPGSHPDRRLPARATPQRRRWEPRTEPMPLIVGLPPVVGQAGYTARRDAPWKST